MLNCKTNFKYCNGDKPLKPQLAYVGGKSKLADKIIKQIPNHSRYIEVFLGGGSIFYKKPLAEENIINDKDKNIVKIHKSFRDGSGFAKCNIYPSKKKFKEHLMKKNKSVCDIAYLNKWSFGSDIKSKRYVLAGDTKGKLKKYGNRYRPRDKTFGIKYQKSHQEDYKEKLKNTTVVNQDFEQVMKKHDSKYTFHYLDPPYVGTESVYKENKNISAERVCKVAKSMNGSVMISYNDHKDVREACKGMHFKKVNTRYTLSANSNNTKAKEVLITNY